MEKERSPICKRNGCKYSGKECEFWNTCVAFVGNITSTKRRASKFSPTEEEIQRSVVEFCDIAHIMCVHIPNEGKRSPWYAAKLKAMGMQKGFPDIHIPYARNGYHAMYIELKRDKNSHPTKEQFEWIANLNKNGYYAVVAYGADAAINEIKKYMGVK